MYYNNYLNSMSKQKRDKLMSSSRNPKSKSTLNDIIYIYNYIIIIYNQKVS